MKILGVFLALTVFCNSCCSSAQNVDAATKDRINHLIETYLEWGPELSTPGMSITLTVSERLSDGVKLTMTTSGLPKDKVYTMVGWPITQGKPSTLSPGVTLSPAGGPVCTGKPGHCKGDKPDDPVDFKAMIAPGEPVRLGLISEDGTVKVFGKLIPTPVAGDDRGCRVEAIMIVPGSAAVLFQANGFKPNEKLTITSQSGADKSVHEEHANQSGRYQMVDMPYVDNVAAGDVTFTAKASHCSPSVNMHWSR